MKRHQIIAALVMMCLLMLVGVAARAGTVSTTVDQAAGSIIEFSYTLPDSSSHALASHLCKRAKLIAPVNSAGTGTNAAPIFYGDANAQLDWIATDGSRDDFVHVFNSSLIYVKGTAGDVIVVRCEY